MDQYWLGETIFTLKPATAVSLGTTSESETLLNQWTPKQQRQVNQRVRQLTDHGTKSSSYDIMEIFSPPRFAVQAATQGKSCLSADLLTGWDFRKVEHRRAIRNMLEHSPPKLLVCCPPCTWAGGWYHLNKEFMSEAEIAEKRRLTLLFINFCCELIEISKGGYALFEHPKSSLAWKLPRMNRLFDRMQLLDCDMCMFGLQIPHDMLIRKPTRLLVSHDSMKNLGRKCPGDSSPKHAQHQPVAGSHPQVGKCEQIRWSIPTSVCPCRDALCA